MMPPAIPGKRPVFSASKVLEAIGEELTLIKSQDSLTWDDIARVIGKSRDQAAKYADGSAEMGVVAFAAAKREWNGRFTGALDRLIRDSRPVATDDHGKHTRILEAALTIARSLQEHGSINGDDMRRARPELEAARDALNEVLDRPSLGLVRT